MSEDIRDRIARFAKIEALTTRIEELEACLDEVLNYSGGADHALDDPYVVDRARQLIEGQKRP